MVKVAQMDIPPAYQSLLDKILSYFDNQMYPTWATRYFHTTRAAKKANKEKTYLPSISAAWGALTTNEKDAWRTASDFGTLNCYQLFTTDYSYRRKNNLIIPGTPSDYHEVMGLRLQNPGPESEVRVRNDEKDLVGPITISFNYKKTENVASPGNPFYCVATAYYFWEGKNQTVTTTWTAPDGNIDWTTANLTLGSYPIKYFHLTIIWYLDNYDATIDLDHLLIQGNAVDKLRECWQYKSGKEWAYDNLYRKTGWLFSPGFRVPYFEVLYLN
jgi:hypothetical protein